MLNIYEKSLILQGLNLLRIETESTIKRQRETYQGIPDGPELIQGNEELLHEIKALKSKIKD
jgi:hypothetical protein